MDMMRKITVLFLLFLMGCKVVSKSELQELQEQDKQAKGQINLESLWQDKIPDFANTRAIKFNELTKLQSLENDELATFASKNSNDAKWHIFISDDAKILELHTKKPEGDERKDAYALIDFPPYDNKADAKLQLGPIFKGSSLRDSLPFASFSNFTNQMEYSKSSRQLHKYVEEQVTKNKRASLAEGQQLKLLSVGTLEFSDLLLLTPINIE